MRPFLRCDSDPDFTLAAQPRGHRGRRRMPVCRTAQRSAGSAITKEWTGNAGTRGRDQSGLGRHQGGTDRQGGGRVAPPPTEAWRRRGTWAGRSATCLASSPRTTGSSPPRPDRRRAGPAGRHRGAGTPRSGPAARRAARPSASAPRADTSLTGAETVIDIVTDDMPYLVDSVTMELNRHGADILLIVHPVLTVHRDVAGAAHGTAIRTPARRRPTRTRSASPGSTSSSGTSTTPSASPPTCAASSMTCGSRWRTSAACGPPPATWSSCSPTGGPEEAEASELLAWLSAGHFTFLGYRAYDLVGRGQARS